MEQVNEFLDKHKLPLALSVIGIVLIIGGLYSSGLTTKVVNSPSLLNAKNFPKESKVDPSDLNPKNEIKIDISGAVNKPGVYSLESNTRVEDAVNLADGFSTKANKDYISKQLNLSQKLSDGIKIYIPFEGEISVPLVAGASTQSTQATQSSKISINNASQKELEELPGIGPVTAQKIIKNRPYSSIDDLITKKSVSKSVFAKIKELIDL